MAVDAEFEVDPLDMTVHSVGGDAQFLSDGQFLFTIEDILEDFSLAGGHVQCFGDRVPLRFGEERSGPNLHGIVNNIWHALQQHCIPPSAIVSRKDDTRFSS